MKSKFIRALFSLWLIMGIVPTLAQDSSRPLSEQVGFSDPKLDELQAAGQTVLGESQDFSAYGRTYRLLTVWSVLPGYPDDFSGDFGSRLSRCCIARHPEQGHDCVCGGGRSEGDRRGCVGGNRG